MNGIANVPGTGRGSARVNGPAGDSGTDLDFQLALGLAAAGQARAPYEARAQAAPLEEQRVTDKSESDTAIATDDESEAPLRESAGEGGEDAARPGRAGETKHEPRVRAAAESPGAAQNVASPAPAAESAAAEGAPAAPRVAGSATALAGVAQQAPPDDADLSPASPRAPGGTMGAVMSAEHAAASAGAHSHVIARRLANPVPVVAPTSPRAAGAKPATAAASVHSQAVFAAPPASTESASPGSLGQLVAMLTSAAAEESASAGATAMPAAPAAAVESPEPAAVSMPAGVARSPVASVLAQGAADRLANPAAMSEAPAPVITAASAAVAQAAATVADPMSNRAENASEAPPAQNAAPAPRAEAAPARHELARPVAPAPGAVARERQESRDGSSKQGGDQSRRESAPAPAAPAAPAAAATGTTATENAANAGSPARIAPATPAAPVAEPIAPAAVRDPRLEPMRRAADQVTLQFRGEDGLEGRLRISVRGDSV
ncbi:MAG: hypothetical protein IT348_14465, partial [Candidatus Eisenbacteria bacterium]|nr:hypothetical protein [Candidatus Eisenbacteria bacterium]